MIDLHTHTTASDGTDSPFALVKKALATGVTTLGITDHDSTAGWAEAVTAIQPQIQLVLGAEVSCLTNDGISVHMLGLLFDGEDEQIQQMLSDSRDTRLPRMRKMVALLQADGFDISLEDVYLAAPDQATIGRPHLADALVAKKIVAHVMKPLPIYFITNLSTTSLMQHRLPLMPSQRLRELGESLSLHILLHLDAVRF